MKNIFKKIRSNQKLNVKKCTTKLLDLGEFEGGLVGKALKDVVDGKDNFKETKIILDGCLKVVSERSLSEIINFMINISNNMKQTCSHCHGVSWGKID